jgi:hypothetical protein
MKGFIDYFDSIESQIVALEQSADHRAKVEVVIANMQHKDIKQIKIEIDERAHKRASKRWEYGLVSKIASSYELSFFKS